MTERREMGGPVVLNGSRIGVISAFFGLWLGALATRAFSAPDDTSESFGSNAVSLAELRNAVYQHGRSIQSFRSEAVVCAVVPGRNLLAIQDSSAGVLVEVPALDGGIRPGDLVSVTGDHCAVTRSQFGIQLGTAPVVNNDGHHRAFFKSGSVFLAAGFQPIRLTWFNGYGLSALEVNYEGPGVGRQEIPAAALWRKPPEADFQPGLDFAAYTGNWFYTLPDFPQLAPVARGVATNFDLKYSVRPENTALAFSGSIKIETTGIYTFYVNSDDGSYLYAGNPAASCQITVLRHESVPAPMRFKEVLAAGKDHMWTELEGEVTFVGQNEEALELEVSGKGERARVEVMEPPPSFTNLLHQHVRAVGILEASPYPEERTRSRMIVPGRDQLEIQDLADDGKIAGSAANKILTTVEDIRQLTRADAAKGLPAKIRGVVTWSSPEALVVQDATGGLYIQYLTGDWLEQPSVGEAWEIEGKTDPGDFSPVIYARKATFAGSAVLPEPIHPTWDQLLNGSLDAQYVELRGALTEVSPTYMTLLTSEGKIRIRCSDDRPLPLLPAVPAGQVSYVDSVVRIRGCLTALWDQPAHQVVAGDIFLSPGAVEIDEFAPRDPFGMPTKRVTDLLLFDPNAGVLQRIKVRGQIVLVRMGEYFLQDGKAGMRLRTKEPLPLQRGDAVEAVGFPQLGGPSPVLQEARVRTNGPSSLPVPVPLAATELLNRSHDSTRVQVEAMLLNDRFDRDERVLELQAGQSHFIARLKTVERGATPLATGSRLQLTGVYLSAAEEQAGGNLDPFELWLSSPAEIRVLQRPPWWTLRRALTIVAVLSGVLGIALIWIKLLQRKVVERTAQLQKEIEERQLVEQRRVMEQERTRVAQDLHDELGAGLTEMGLLGDLMKNPSVPTEEKRRYLGQLTDTARTLVASLDEIVWAVNPRYDSVADLASYYTLFAQRFLDLAHVACRPQIPASFPEYPLDPKDRHGLFLAFKEALNNVVRHSGATEVRLRIEVAQGDLIILIADNGHGFDLATESPRGEGLQGMVHRLDQLGGGCDIRSSPGVGTEVKLRLPVGNHAP
jgi:signal transduction histidine kinase